MLCRKHISRQNSLNGFILIFVFFCLAACKNNSNQNKENSPTIIGVNIAKADSSWNLMMKSDDAKLDNMIRLADELLLIENCDSASIIQARDQILGLRKIRYTKETLGEPGLIDRYDSLTTAAIGLLRAEINRNDKAGHYQLIERLKSEIITADDSVLFYRKDYDYFASILNEELKKNNKAALPAIEGLKNGRLPLFRLIP
jgi:hypothetical protein